MLAAAGAVAGAVTDADVARGALYPPLPALREVALRVACAVAKRQARGKGGGCGG